MRPALTLQDAARAIGVCPGTATRLIKTGRLRAYRVGLGPKAQFRVPADAVDEFMARHQVAPCPSQAPSLGREIVEDDTFR